MRTVILGGFLGSGKTSVLLQLARYLQTKSFRAPKAAVMVIENEAAKNGIDNLTLQSVGLTVRELFAGCVCCTLVGELNQTIRQIQHSAALDWLIIEATGIAYPASMKRNLKETLDLDTDILAVVDAQRWDQLLLAMESLLLGQLEDSRCVLINKVDLVPHEKVMEIKSYLQQIEPALFVQAVSAKGRIPESVWEECRFAES